MKKKTFKERFKSFLTWDVSDLKNDLHQQNEVLANRTTAIAMFNCALLIFIALLLDLVGVFNIYETTFLYLDIAAVEFLVAATICFIVRGRGKALRYIMIVSLILGISACYIALSSLVLLAMVIPLVLSCRYYNRKFVLFTAGLTCVMMFVSIFLSVIYKSVDLNAITFDSPITITVDGKSRMDICTAIFENLETRNILHKAMIQIGIPNLLFIITMTLICVQSAGRGQSMAKEEIAIVQKSSRIESELNVATDIQANMLPRIFPAFPEHLEFDIYAKMMPAKEVGGDFYDFFMIDDSHLAIVIADVSGKGVPAALFMVTAKTLIKDHAQMRLEPDEVFTRVNRILCDGNDAGLFVTGWMGIVDLSTGLLKYVNAGHNPPLVKQGDKFTYLKKKKGIVLAAFDAVIYRQQELQLNPGDKILLYTDGVTEATNKEQQLYGEDRLLNFVNENNDIEAKDIIQYLRDDIDKFACGAEQFDDITIVAFNFKQFLVEKNEKEFIAEDKYLDNASQFMQEELDKVSVPQKTISQMLVALEEVFINVAHYAYPRREGKLKLTIDTDDNVIKVTVKDFGIPFNPLDRFDPDITLSAEDRDIGGLGIFMVKKIMDTVDYKYKDGMNVLTFTKKY